MEVVTALKRCKLKKSEFIGEILDPLLIKRKCGAISSTAIIKSLIYDANDIKSTPATKINSDNYKEMSTVFGSKMLSIKSKFNSIFFFKTFIFISKSKFYRFANFDFHFNKLAVLSLYQN